MKIALFSAKPYDVASFTAANGSFGHELAFFEDRMRGRAAPLAEGFPAVCLFVNDIADARVLVTAHQGFLTHEALDAIATITLQNLSDLEAGRPCPNAL